jgi:hypothetical protein
MNSRKRRAVTRRVAVLGVIAVIVVAAVAVSLYAYSSLSSACTYSAQPGPLFLRVLSDENQTPVAGAQVSATNTPFLCNGLPVTPQRTQTFVTNSTQWLSLGGAGVMNSDFSFVVRYSGQTYSFSARLGIEAVTCVTLLVPSGVTNETFGEFQSTCPAGAMDTSSSSLSTSASTTSTTLASTSANVVQLQVKLNTTTIHSGHAVSAQITITNPLNQNVSIVPDYQADGSILSWNSYDFMCGGLAASNPTWSLAGYALFKGHYTSANLSSAGAPLSLNPPLVIECPAEPVPSSVVFYPNGSSIASYFEPGQNGIPYPTVVTGHAAMNATTETYVYESGYYGYGSTGLFGYWVGPPGGVFGGGQNATIDSPYFHYFSPGEYTLVVEDMWGQSVYSYFEVTS